MTACPQSDVFDIWDNPGQCRTAFRYAGAHPWIPVQRAHGEPQIPAFAAGGWRVIVPQLRGFDGGTDDPPAAAMNDYAGDVIDLLDALHVEDAVISGFVDGRLRHAGDVSPRAPVFSAG